MTDGAASGAPGWDFAWYRRMRDTDPVWRSPQTGAWHIFRYRDVATVLSAHHTFSTGAGARHGHRPQPGHIASMDPPEHERLRRLVRREFAMAAMSAVRPRIAPVTATVIGAVGASGRVDFMTEVARPLPRAVIAEFFGLPAGERALFDGWADRMVFPRTETDAADAAAELHAYLSARVRAGGRAARARVRAPGGDLIGNLLAARRDGDRLRPEEVVGFAVAVLYASYATTTFLLGNAMLCLEEYPDVQVTLRADPAGIPDAVEEVLRYSPPVETTVRVATEDLELSGTKISAGEPVRFSIMSANHDERQFDRPDEFLPTRRPNPHLAFGKGVHFCLGATLARLTARAAVQEMLTRFRWFGIDRSRPARLYPTGTTDPGGAVNGAERLHLLTDLA